MIDDEAVRALALALPEVAEQDHQGQPSFRVRGKIFATLQTNERRAVLKLAIADQAALAALAPGIFSLVPGAWGQQGWTNVDLEMVGPSEFESALRAAWRQVAPKRLISAYEQAG